jgi:hypothetical protein
MLLLEISDSCGMKNLLACFALLSGWPVERRFALLIFVASDTEWLRLSGLLATKTFAQGRLERRFWGAGFRFAAGV